jgi:hypothetical protein
MQSWIEELGQSFTEKKDRERQQIMLLERSREVAPILYEELADSLQRDLQASIVALGDQGIRCSRSSDSIVVKREALPSFRLEAKLRGGLILVSRRQTRSFSSPPESNDCRLEVCAGTGPDDYCYLNAGFKLQTAPTASEYLLRPPFKLIVEAI